MEGGEEGSSGHDGEPHTVVGSRVGQHAGRGTKSFLSQTCI